MTRFYESGYQVFRPETAVLEWAKHALDGARRALDDPAMDHWYQCERTWFVGIDALNNDSAGRIGSSPALCGAAVDFASEHCGGWLPLHKAQVSGVFAGYPRPRAGESKAAFRYRKERYAAHVDGVIGKGHPKRRFVEEPHAFILGLPLTHTGADAAPLVVWEGSHLIMQDAFRKVFADVSGAPEQVDVTDAYQAARAEVFLHCPQIHLSAPPGSAILLHRLTVHGVAPWTPGAKAPPEGRLIAYFRPPMPGGVLRWVSRD